MYFGSLVPAVYRHLLSPSSGHKNNPEGGGSSCSKVSELYYQIKRRHVPGDTAVIILCTYMPLLGRDAVGRDRSMHWCGEVSRMHGGW